MGGNLLSRSEGRRCAHLFVVLPLCLFGPYTIFSGNEAEISAPFWTLARPILLAGAGIALALIALGLVLPSRLFRSYSRPAVRCRCGDFNPGQFSRARLWPARWDGHRLDGARMAQPI